MVGRSTAECHPTEAFRGKEFTTGGAPTAVKALDDRAEFSKCLMIVQSSRRQIKQAVTLWFNSGCMAVSSIVSDARLGERTGLHEAFQGGPLGQRQDGHANMVELWDGHRRTWQATAEQADRGFKQAQRGAGLLLLHSAHLLSGRARPFKASSVRVGAAPRGQ